MPYPYVSFGSQVNRSLEPLVERRLRKTENEGRIGYEQQQADQVAQGQRANIDYKAGLDQALALRKKQDEQERDTFIIDRLVQSGMTPEAAAQLHYGNVQPQKPREPINAFKDILLPMSQAGENRARANRLQAETDDPSRFRTPPAGNKPNNAVYLQQRADLEDELETLTKGQKVGTTLYMSDIEEAESELDALRKKGTLGIGKATPEELKAAQDKVDAVKKRAKDIKKDIAALDAKYETVQGGGEVVEDAPADESQLVVGKKYRLPDGSIAIWHGK